MLEARGSKELADLRLGRAGSPVRVGMHFEPHGPVRGSRQHDMLICDRHDGADLDEIEQLQHVGRMQAYAPVGGEPVDAGRLVGAVDADARGTQRQPPVAERVVGAGRYRRGGVLRRAGVPGELDAPTGLRRGARRAWPL